jgi:hypothetical protein
MHSFDTLFDFTTQQMPDSSRNAQLALVTGDCQEPVGSFQNDFTSIKLL